MHLFPFIFYFFLFRCIFYRKYLSKTLSSYIYFVDLYPSLAATFDHKYPILTSDTREALERRAWRSRESLTSYPRFCYHHATISDSLKARHPVSSGNRSAFHVACSFVTRPYIATYWNIDMQSPSIHYPAGIRNRRL